MRGGEYRKYKADRVLAAAPCSLEDFLHGSDDDDTVAPTVVAAPAPGEAPGDTAPDTAETAVVTAEEDADDAEVDALDLTGIAALEGDY